MRLDHLLSREYTAARQSQPHYFPSVTVHHHDSGVKALATTFGLLYQHLSKFILLQRVKSTSLNVVRFAEPIHEIIIVEHHVMCSRKEDRMSIGWMPRRCVPMKDVA